MHPRTKIRTFYTIYPRKAARERSETEPPEIRVLCTLRMRHNQKFFSSVEPKGGSRTIKDILKKILPFGQPLSYKSRKSYMSQKCACGTV